MEHSHNELVQIRIEKLKKLQAEGKDPFINERFDYTHHTVDVLEKFDELEGQDVAVSGRVMLFGTVGAAGISIGLMSGGYLKNIWKS